VCVCVCVSVCVYVRDIRSYAAANAVEQTVQV